MKLTLEDIRPDADSSFKLLLTPKLNDIFFWHFHPEFEIVYVEASEGIRHIGEHVSKYQGSDLAFIGSNIPHLNFDYGAKTLVDTVVVQMKEHFLGKHFFSLPEISSIDLLFERSKTGLAFYGATKKAAGEKLKRLQALPHFEQLIVLLEVFHLLALSTEFIELKVSPLNQHSALKDQQRLQKIYHYIDTHFQHDININEVAAVAHLSKASFCRYFKKSTHLTFTEFLNQYRINQAKKMLLQHKSVNDACYEVGFENISHFYKTFKKITGETPSSFKKRQTI